MKIIFVFLVSAFFSVLFLLRKIQNTMSTLFYLHYCKPSRTRAKINNSEIFRIYHSTLHIEDLIHLFINGFLSTCYVPAIGLGKEV